MKKIVISILIMLLISIIILCISNIDTTKATPTTLADTVISLLQGDTYTAGNGNGVYQTNNHEYRYVGGEVNNYVSFNNDLYRIIGVFDSNTTGVSGNLVKLIMARELTAAAWGVYNLAPSYTIYSNYKNDWTGTTTGVAASANILLNEYFLNRSDMSTTYGQCIDWTYAGQNITTRSENCINIKGYGIQSENLRNYIQPVTWYLYGYTGVSLSKQNWYNCERNNYSGCTSANAGAYSGTTTASVGLMYVSDYMYASGYVASNATTTGSSFDFINLNWLYNGWEWTITPRGDNDNYLFDVNYTGNIHSFPSYNGLGLRPTFYLKSSVYVTGGDGSFHNPYTIACDDCNS